MRELSVSTKVGSARRVGLVVARFPDEVDLGCAPELRERLLALLGRGVAGLAGDLSGTRFCDCSGLNAVLAARARAAALGTPFGLVLPRTGTVWKVFRISGVAATIPHAPTLEDLAALLGAAPVPAGVAGAAHYG